jgi:glucose/arabinose dehydrogenase
MKRWTVRLVPSLLAGLMVASVGLATPAAAGRRIHAREVVGHLDRPVAFTFGPGRKIWYVEKTTGAVRFHDLDTGADRRFVRVRGVDGQGERGMLGIDLDPDYPNRPFVYLYVTRSAHGSLRNQILRYRNDDGRGHGRTLLHSTPASGPTNHNGGRILFGPDGMLYAIIGDHANPAHSQDLSTDLGKIIRITRNGRAPDDNPFDDNVWVYGIRNSFGFAFDPQTGVMWETENGPECNDELNRVVAGDNYGWGPNETCSGSSPGNTNQDGPNPVLPELFHENAIGITGIVFCDGCRLGHRSEGAAFTGAVNNGHVTRILFNDQRSSIASHSVVYRHGGSTLSYEVSPGGRIYFSDFDGINKLVRN